MVPTNVVAKKWRISISEYSTDISQDEILPMAHSSAVIFKFSRLAADHLIDSIGHLRHVFLLFFGMLGEFRTISVARTDCRISYRRRLGRRESRCLHVGQEGWLLPVVLRVSIAAQGRPAGTYTPGSPAPLSEDRPTRCRRSADKCGCAADRATRADRNRIATSVGPGSINPKRCFAIFGAS